MRWKPLESPGLAVRFGVSMPAMISPRAWNRFQDIVVPPPVQARPGSNGGAAAVPPGV
jgi:hypothetical protein